jgi:PPOX class probable F420-dependent enzyme
VKTKLKAQLSAEARHLLEAKAFAHVAVVDTDCRPRSTPVWIDVDGDTVWINTAVGRVKERLLPVGAPVAISATDPGNPYRYVEIRGHVAERRTDTADADIDALAKKYLAEDKYPFRRPGEQRVTIVIEPERVIGP